MHVGSSGHELGILKSERCIAGVRKIFDARYHVQAGFSSYCPIFERCYL